MDAAGLVLFSLGFQASLPVFLQFPQTSTVPGIRFRFAVVPYWAVSAGRTASATSEFGPTKEVRSFGV
jgi:hypothetical protein